MKLLRLLLVTDSPTLPVSYANVGRHFADAVAPLGVEVAFGSLQHSDSMLSYEFKGRKYRHYGCAPPQQRIGAAIEDYDPDLIVHLRDPVAMAPRLFPQSYSVKAPARSKPVWQWVPVPDELMAWDIVEVLHREADVVLPFTRAGGDKLGNAGMVRDRIEPLTLGVSESYSDPEGPVAGGYGRPGVPIVMTVGLAHQERKPFPMLMRAYHEVAGQIDLEFYLHATMAGAYDLPEHARMLGVDGRWIFPHLYDPGVGYPEEELAARYRRALAYASLGTAEGWDMPLSEACALGRVVIYPNEPTRSEVVSDYEGPKLRYETFPIPRMAAWERLADPVSLGEQLAKLRDLKPDPTAGRRYYAAHSWAKTAERFVEIARGRGLM